MSSHPTVRAPRGTTLTCRGWVQEAALRMLMNNLDPEVAERPEDLVVYGGTGKAARDWGAFDRIVSSLRTLGDDETLLVQSGKPVGILKTHPDAPRVLIANSNLVPHWATWENFWDLEKRGLTMYGQMTAGSWIYIGSQDPAGHLRDLLPGGSHPFRNRRPAGSHHPLGWPGRNGWCPATGRHDGGGCLSGCRGRRGPGSSATRDRLSGSRWQRTSMPPWRRSESAAAAETALLGRPDRKRGSGVP